MSSELKNIIEAVLMVSDAPLGVTRIQGLFDKDSTPEAAEIKQAITQLQADCEARSVELQKVGTGYRYQTKMKYAQWIRKMQAGKPPRLSRAQLETLAIIAYRQPVTRGDIEEIRGVAVSTDIMQRLMEREWVKTVGVRDTPGRPELFATTVEFLSYFSLENLSELPSLVEQRDFGDIAKDLDINLPPEVLFALEGDDALDENQADVFEVSLEESQKQFAEFGDDDNEVSEESFSENKVETNTEITKEDDAEQLQDGQNEEDQNAKFKPYESSGIESKENTMLDIESEEEVLQVDAES